MPFEDNNDPSRISFAAVALLLFITVPQVLWPAESGASRNKMVPTAPGKVRWTGGFWAERFTRVRDAVTAAYLWSGAADVYAETGEPALWAALDRLWRDFTGHKILITGGIGVHQNFKSKRGDSVGESFGYDYQLPNRVAYNETCANIANAMWNRRMLALTGEAKYADVMELVLYNSMLSAWSLDGKAFFYTNSLRRLGKELPLQRNDWPTRWPDNDQPGMLFGFCCPPSVARTVAQLQDWAYSLSPEGVWVHLFGANRMECVLPGGGAVRLRQETAYPWEGEIRLLVEQAPESEFALIVRIPGWAGGTRMLVNDQPVPGVAAGTYSHIKRAWKQGDQVTLRIPLDPRLVEANPYVEETLNQVAVMRGPLVYCLESHDLPAGAGIFDVAIPRDIRLQVKPGDGPLTGMSLLEGSAIRRSVGDFGPSLYRPLRYTAPETFLIRLIPYYAWANRGIGSMSVWLPAALGRGESR
jgi:hypothetical protein